MAILAALCLTLLLGFVALAIDVGILFRAKRVLQTAADSAAIAGAAEVQNQHFGGSWQRADSSQNGVTDGVNGATVAVDLSRPGYVTVVASQSVPTFFLKLFSRGTMTVNAKAVATTVPSPSCVDYVGMGTTAPGINMPSGSAILTLSSCGVLDNATGSGALTINGASGVRISATSIGVVGTALLHNGVLTDPAPVTGIPPFSDPLSSFATPPPASDYNSGCLANTTIKTDQTIGPSSPTGYVCYSGLSFPKGSPTVTLNPGLYIFNGSAGLNVAQWNDSLMERV